MRGNWCIYRLLHFMTMKNIEDHFGWLWHRTCISTPPLLELGVGLFIFHCHLFKTKLSFLSLLFSTTICADESPHASSPEKVCVWPWSPLEQLPFCIWRLEWWHFKLLSWNTECCKPSTYMETFEKKEKYNFQALISMMNKIIIKFLITRF